MLMQMGRIRNGAHWLWFVWKAQEKNPDADELLCPMFVIRMAERCSCGRVGKRIITSNREYQPPATPGCCSLQTAGG